MSSLKNCPFCNGKGVISSCTSGDDNEGYYALWSVYCIDCGSETGDDVCRDTAIKKWNNRAESSEVSSIDQLERIKELEQSLSTMTHAAKELYGVISEHSLMLCRSLETRMMDTANRYATRIFGESNEPL